MEVYISKAAANKGVVMNELLQEDLPAGVDAIRIPDFPVQLFPGDFPHRTGSFVLDEQVELAFGDPQPGEGLDAPLEDHDSH